VFFELLKNGMLGGNQNMWMIEKVASIPFFLRDSIWHQSLVLLVVLFVLFGTYGNQFFLFVAMLWHLGSEF
jgi:hypothetical protein